MFYKTLKTTATGRKFADLLLKIDAAHAAQVALCEKYGIETFRASSFYLWGGFSAVLFNVAPNTKDWKNVYGAKDEWMPKLSSSVGKAVQKEFDALPVVTRKELNACVGFNNHFKHIGFNFCDTHFGFTDVADWSLKIPDDCEEITKIAFDLLFKPQ